MVDIPEQAVQAAYEAMRVRDIRDERSTKERAVDALTAAAPYMSAPAREQALEEAAQIAELHEGEPCGPAIAWTEEQRQFYASGQQDASSSIAAAIRALKSQPVQTGGGE